VRLYCFTDLRHLLSAGVAIQLHFIAGKPSNTFSTPHATIYSTHNYRGFIALLTFGICCRSDRDLTASPIPNRTLRIQPPPSILDKLHSTTRKKPTNHHSAPIIQPQTPRTNYRGFIALLTFGICCRSALRFNCPTNPKPHTAGHHHPPNWINYQPPTPLTNYRGSIALLNIGIGCRSDCRFNYQPPQYCSTYLRHLLPA
jgi:hypothetical protein